MKTNFTAAAIVTTLAAVVVCAHAEPVEMFPGVRVDHEGGKIEFDGGVSGPGGCRGWDGSVS